MALETLVDLFTHKSNPDIYCKVADLISDNSPFISHYDYTLEAFSSNEQGREWCFAQNIYCILQSTSIKVKVNKC